MEQKFYSHFRPPTDDLPRNWYAGTSQTKFIQDIVTKSGFGANTDTAGAIYNVEMTALTPIFIKSFPLYDMLRKEPANGVSHTWRQWTAYTQTSDPNTIAETGFVNDDANTYMRKTTNIALFAIRRSASLKASLAGTASGFDLFDAETRGGMLTLARDVQNESLKYQNSDPATVTVAGINGKYDANGYNGFRYIAQNEAPPENSMIVNTSVPNWTDARVLSGIRYVADAMADKGGSPNLIICSNHAAEQLFQDELSFVRYVIEGRQLEITPGYSVRAVSTNQGLLPVMIVPGGQGIGIGQYTNAGHNYEDAYVVDTTNFTLPYLGNPSPTLTRIPLGVAGQLVELAIIWAMYGLACYAPSLSMGRVQLQLT